MRFLAIVLVGLSLSGCATAPKDYAYMTSNEYQGRQQIKGGLQRTADGRLNDADINRFLSGRIAMPKTMTLGLVRLANSYDGLGFSRIDDSLSKLVFDTKAWGPRVRSVTPIPSLVIPRPASLESLREAAARVQADMLVIVSPATDADWKLNLFRTDEAKAKTLLEVVLLDTRTGAIPYTALIEEESGLIKREGSDFDMNEAMNRARAESEKKALVRVSADIQAFLATVK